MGGVQILWDLFQFLPGGDLFVSKAWWFVGFLLFNVDAVIGTKFTSFYLIVTRGFVLVFSGFTWLGWYITYLNIVVPVFVAYLNFFTMMATIRVVLLLKGHIWSSSR